ncbi:sugar ABC transporter substrate-binding protein [Anoxynatronum buryatiense]|uniref:Monosaccharide ABC transporter substrate-binding protein, CUT2 family n=1 Tax=Anoxynatronum buryatiense TaxID=489973 RepID=A0AA45WYM2_9CLOT|nr:monosaccharide ABC transporter substrate-binding protein, CUT2 family [Anoxynatronum buryatiense]
MNMKKMIAVFLMVAMMIVSLAGCNSGGSSSGGAETDTYRVAFVARTQADSFAAWLVNEMKSAAEQYPDLTLDVFDGQADDEKVNAAIENAITNGYDAIIVQPNNGEAQRPYVESIVEAGIIAITTNARIEGIDGASSVDADPYVQAKVNADIAIDQIPQNAKVVVLNGPSGNFHADERRRAWEVEFFEKRPDVQIVGEQIAGWNKDEAVRYMEDWVTANSEIHAIISMNDNMAAGALEVVKNNPALSDILSYGVDGTPEATLLINEGTMTSTCLQSAIDLAEANISTVHKLLTGEEDEIHMDIDAILITGENAQAYVDMYTERGLIN